MPGAYVVVGQSEAEAQDKAEQFQALVDPRVGVALLGRMLGNFDLSGYPLDGPLPELPPTEDGQRSRQQLLTELAGSERLTLAQLGQRIAGGRGHLSLIGTPVQIADQLQAWFEGVPPTASTSWCRTCPRGWTTSPAWWCPSCSAAGCFAASTRAAPCVSTWAWPGPPILSSHEA